MAHDSSSAWVRGLIDLFVAQGVDAAVLLQACGIAPERLADRHGRFDVDEVSQLWRQAIVLSGREALGMDRELAARHIDFDDVAYAMLACADLRSGVQAFGRYLDLLSSATAFAIVEDSHGAWLSMLHTGARCAVPWQRAAYSLLALLAMCRWLVRRDIRPLAVQVRHAAPSAAADAACVQAFGCPVTYGAADNRLKISASDLALPVPSHNPRLLALHERVIHERMAVLLGASLRTRVSETIAAMLVRGTPRREDVAHRLGLSPRKLQRQLQLERTSYQQVLDETRRDLARSLLTDDQRAICEVAYLLGFADESNFFRACRRWYRVAPGQLRRASRAHRCAAAKFRRQRR